MAHHLPHATYVGLDPHRYATGGKADVRNETISQLAASHPEEYDVVYAFHNIQHLVDPLCFARDLATCTRPGGRLLHRCAEPDVGDN